MRDPNIEVVLNKIDSVKELMKEHVKFINGRIGEMAKNTDNNIENILEHIKEQAQCIDRHEKRIRKTEIWRGWMTGSIATLGAITTVLAVFQFFTG